MRIRRSRRDSHFTILANATIRDDRLSYRARGVLAELLSRPDDWETTADALSGTAKRARGKQGEGRDAMRSVFKELEAAGYMVRHRARNDAGQHETTVFVFDTPQDTNPQVAPMTENQASAGQSSVNQASIRSTDTKQRNEEDKTCLQPASRVGATNSFDPSLRDQDRRLFDELIGGSIKTDRSKWKTEDPNACVFTAGAFYNAFRKRRDNPIRYPGQWLQEIDTNGGFNDWLIDEGLEVVSVEAPF